MENKTMGSMITAAKEGVDLTHPKASVGYIMGGVIAVAVIMVIFWIVSKGKEIIAPKVSNLTGGLENQASTQLQGFL